MSRETNTFETPLKDSGSRSEFNTGAVRDNGGGKGRFDLLPVDAIEQLAKHFEKGALKYEARNWEKGIPLSRYLDSALRHTFKALRGDTDEPHAVAAAWNQLCFIQTLIWIEQGVLPKSLNDLPVRNQCAAAQEAVKSFWEKAEHDYLASLDDTDYGGSFPVRQFWSASLASRIKYVEFVGTVGYLILKSGGFEPTDTPIELYLASYTEFFGTYESFVAELDDPPVFPA